MRNEILMDLQTKAALIVLLNLPIINWSLSKNKA